MLLVLLLVANSLIAQTVSLPRSIPEDEGVSSQNILEFLDAAEKSKHEFHSLMVIRHGKVVAEGWWKPYEREIPHTMYSVSKSFTSTAIGFAVKENLLKLDDPVVSFFPNEAPPTISDNLKELRVRHLLSMTVGHQPDPTGYIVTRDTNWVKAFLSTPILHKPGSRFLYNTMATYMLSAILQKVTGQKLFDYLQPRLFQPLGISGNDWEVDLQGINVGGWGLRIRTEDMAKLGLLYLQKGRWNGTQLLPEQWVEEATTKQILQSPEASQPARDSSDWLQGYGYQFWRSRNNSFRGDGAFGQFIIVLPEQDAVIAITAETADMQDEFNLVWKYLYPAFKRGKIRKDKQAHRQLQERLASLSLPVSAPGTIAAAQVLQGSTYSVETNDKKIKRISFSSQGNILKLGIRTDSTNDEIDFTSGDWAADTTSRHGPYLLGAAKARFIGLPAFQTRGNYEWKNGNTLELKLRYVESPHSEYMNFQFDKDNVVINARTSLDPHGKTTTIKGKIADDLTIRMDSIFQEWNKPNSPGVAVGVIRNDSLIFAKGYGLANLEYNIPNTPTTIFHMASVSKQFAAYSLILLEAAGRLSLEDDVRKYLTWFPDMKKKITIRQLLTHTSGIRDQWQLLAISGTRLDDVIMQDHVVKLLSAQRELNFEPGDRFSYSNSGYTMAAEIVKSVTGQTLRQFTDSAIFKPLGMNNTHFHDDYTEIVKDRAYSYSQDSSGYSNAVLSYSVAGATSLFTNIEDLSKWVMNFYSPKAGSAENLQSLERKSKLNNGKENRYAQGIFVGDRHGFKELSHSGGDAGFRTYLTVFPEKKFGVLVFSNLGEINVVGKAYEVADYFLKPSAGEKKDPKSDSAQAKLQDSLLLKPFFGDYISEEGLQFSLVVEDNMLHMKDRFRKLTLMPDNKGNYTLLADTAVHIRLIQKGINKLLSIETPMENFTLERINKSMTTDLKKLKEYVGSYYSPELNTTYSIVLKDQELWLTHNKYNDTKIEISGPNNLSVGHWWMSNLLIRRDSRNAVEGFNITSGRIRGLRFNKMKQ